MFPDVKPSGVPQRVLIVAAHPDDAEFMAGGSLAAWHRQGASIHFCLVTDGTGGSRDPDMTPAELARIRREEQRGAARELGSDDVTFLGHIDGRVEASLELRMEIARVIRRVRPDTMVVQDPLFRYSSNYINHPDHIAVANATLAAIMPVANTRLSALELLDEGLEPHDVHEHLSRPCYRNEGVCAADRGGSRAKRRRTTAPPQPARRVGRRQNGTRMGSRNRQAGA